MSSGVRDIRHLYPRITENHLRYLEKWRLIRPAGARGDGEFTFSEIATIKQLAAELERKVPLKQVLRSLLAEHQGPLQLDFHPPGGAGAKGVNLSARSKGERALAPLSDVAPDRAAGPITVGNGVPLSDPPAPLAAQTIVEGSE